ncbi:NAD-dependent epimerase/dehydratase family protein [Actinacidiphila sp. ITFR-21]|uniref:NAD-dependent epimerase/dehydratase family protein n=1 Tax=Actinacidiphila sp. ITFR-21 TaxID=3075199 RepID=UPI00288B39DB|nr:NAD(P)-dependent oxidoreductase [Streptomyces sp. ITFR-21]WNI18888.1 NAD(P)-dependent oxidoreductase [Streptomyces sp. ITFR-21]
MTRIFVAGATGAVGRLLVPLLVEAGHQVTAATRTAEGVERLRAQGAEGVRLDVFDRAAVADALAAAAPEAVVHQLTALSGGNPVDNARIRREGTRNLVDAAKKAGVRRIVAQSISWAYEAGDVPADEATALDTGAPEPRATSVGGVVALEEAVAEIDEHVVLRYGTFYGPGTWYAPGGFIAGKLADGALPANSGVSSFVHVDDAARAAVLALGWPSGPVNIVDDEPAPARAWVPVLAAALDRPAPEPSEGGAGWERGAANGKAAGLGWQPRHRTWRTGFSDQG